MTVVLAQAVELTLLIVDMIKPQIMLAIRTAGAQGWSLLTKLEDNISIICS